MSLTFLTYSSRSGSTYLAHQVARRLDVVVVPEFQFPYRVLPLGADTVLAEARVHELLSSDRQLDWVHAVEASEIAQGGILVGDLIRVVVERYALQKGLDADGDYLVKLGGVLQLWGQTKAHLPDAQAVVMLRDGRAVVNSLLSSSSPYLGPGVAMGYGDAWWCARRWAADVETQLAVAEAEPGHVALVRYEELVRDADSTLSDLATRFGWQPRRGTAENSSFGVRAEESGIHRLATGSAQSQRVEAWRQEMPRDVRIVVESLGRRELAAVGADDLLVAPISDRIAIMFRAALEHTKIQGAHGIRRLGRVRSTQEVWDKVRHAVARRR